MAADLLAADVCFVGNYTRDTIADVRGTRIVDGGAFHYGASAAARTGLRTAAVTHLAVEDLRVARGLEALGVAVRVLPTPRSTCLRLEYPSDDPDERVIRVESAAEGFRPADFAGLQARAVVVGASFRGEMGPGALRRLARQAPLLAIDAQGFVRVVRGGELAFERWPGKRAALAFVQVLKADGVEARILTGTDDLQEAARRMQELGPQEIVLTHRDGLLVLAGERELQAPFVPRRILGRSGRGDTCLAAYVCRRLETGPAEAAVWAAALTSLKMESPGPFALDRAAVERLIAERYRTM